ncbi:hypothetical protein K437DRAFT_258005 [Tilletiaria anomala UBC 951]|uniref:TRAF-type domain-containing protein n=1 Tax=Tilletiaria anomala (strain ATCC 24038 / CBS 436.72 / UBC 951) TaxID=1037660 RepID=A0A066VTD9_TILAU|nr:uncharacterized protein K437DRAFT_258005 [Tilletiaria anomala UBC 951]KDN42074.1 hypothetical protein K437DRAFT_258005 [Tilletiaria anomala UBC 951]
MAGGHADHYMGLDDGEHQQQQQHPWEFIYVKPDDEISTWLKCAICLNVFVEPYIATLCQHTFCKLCILKAFEARAESAIESPTFQHQNTPSADGLDPLQDGWLWREQQTHQAAELGVSIAAASAFQREPHTARRIRRRSASLPSSSSSLTSPHENLPRSVQPSASTPTSSSAPCPNCRAPLHLDDVVPATALVQQLVDSLAVYCVHRERGCTHSCERSLLPAHVRKGCGYAYVGEYDDAEEPEHAREARPRQRGCMCGATTILRKDWAAHKGSAACTVRWHACALCGEHKRLGAEMDAHILHACPQARIACRFCRTATCVPRAQMRSHILHSCPDVRVACKLSRFGCMWQGKRRNCSDGILLEEEGPHWTEPAVDSSSGQEDPDVLVEFVAILAGGDDHEQSQQHICPLLPLEPFLHVYAHDIDTLTHENSALRASVDRMQCSMKEMLSALDRCMDGLGPFLPEEDEGANAVRYDYPGADYAALLNVRAPLSPHMPRPTPSGALPSPPSDGGDVSRNSARSHVTAGRTSRSLSSAASSSAASTAKPVRSQSFPSASTMASLRATRLATADGWPQAARNSQGAHRPRSATPHTHTSPTILSPAPASAPAEASHTFRGPVHYAHASATRNTNLTTEFASMRSALDDIALRLRTVESRTDESQMTAISAGFDAGRVREEMQSLRHVVGAIRMQMHQLLMQMQRPRGPSTTVCTSSSAAIAEQEQQQQPAIATQAQTDHGTIGTIAGMSFGPGMGMGIGSVPLSMSIPQPHAPPFMRRWTIFEGTKL